MSLVNVPQFIRTNLQPPRTSYASEALWCKWKHSSTTAQYVTHIYKNLKASLGMHNSLFGHNSTYKLNCPLPHNEDHIIQSRNCNVVINEPNMVRECNIFTLIPMQPLYYKIFFCTNFPTPQLEMCWTWERTCLLLKFDRTISFRGFDHIEKFSKHSDIGLHKKTLQWRHKAHLHVTFMLTSGNCSLNSWCIPLVANSSSSLGFTVIRVTECTNCVLNISCRW